MATRPERLAPLLALLLVAAPLPLEAAADHLEDETRISDGDRAVAREWFARGLQYYEFGLYQEALEAYERAYRVSRDPVYLFDIGMCHRHLGNHGGVIEAFSTYLVHLPHSSLRDEVEQLLMASEAVFGSPFDEGMRLYEEGQHQEALFAFELAQELSPDPENWFHMAQAHRRLGNHGEALFLYEAYMRALPRASNHAEAEGLAQATRMFLGMPTVSSEAAHTGPRELTDPLVAHAERQRARLEGKDVLDRIAAAEASGRSTLVFAPGTPIDIEPVSPWEPLRTWWFWTAVGAVTAGAITIGISQQDPPLPRRTLNPIEYH